MQSTQQRATIPKTLSVSTHSSGIESLPWSVIFLTVFLPLCTLVLWGISLGNTDVDHITDLGLISALPLSFFIAFITLTVSFCLVLYSQWISTPVILLHLAILIFMLSGTVTLVEEAPRLHVAWRHAGFVEYIMRVGALEHKVDAYFDWPIFFALSALVTQISGFESPLSLTSWASVFFNLLYLGPLVMILRSATPDKRSVWLAVWFFYLTHWAGYDFFAPQALNYFLYLVILGVLLRWFRTTSVQRNATGIWSRRFRLLTPVTVRISDWLTREDVLINVPSRPWQRVGLLLIVVALFITSVSSHMLTPFFILAAVTALVVANRLTPRGLPIVMVVMIGTWLSFMAVSYLSGHMEVVTEAVGDVSSNIDANVVRRLRGSPEHIFVVRMRLIMALTIWGLALLGRVQRLRNGYYDLTFTLLAIFPFPVLALQTYGGEMMLRIYMFALPPMLFFAAALFYALPSRNTPWRTEVAIGLVSMVLFVGFLFARYGNERMDYFTSQEVDAARYLYSSAEPGSLLVAVTENLPWRYQDYEKYRHFRLTELGGDVIKNKDVSAIANSMQSSQDRKAFLIITRSQKALAELYLGWEPGSVDRLEQALKESDEFRMIFDNDDATIFVLSSDVQVQD